MEYSGIAELPLHNGHVPDYLLRRMKALGALIAKYIVEAYSPEELLKRLSDPLWFQAFNNVIGMDWDSSGSTTVVLYVLKSTFPPVTARESEIVVLGGKGNDAKNLPREASLLPGDFNPGLVVETSRLAAKVDSVAIQDDYTLYIHGVLVSRGGGLLVVQQGMNTSTRVARRYHIYVDDHAVIDCERDPHSGVASMRVSPALNLVEAESRDSRRAIVEIVVSTPVGSLVRDLYAVNRVLKGLPDITGYASTRSFSTASSEIRDKVSKCPLFYKPITDAKRVAAVAEAIKKEAPQTFRELLLVRGLGPETLRAIALVADLIYGYEPSFKDPTTHPLDPFLYAYAHGGKDGVPYKVRARDVDKTIEFFTRVIDELRAGNREKEILLRNLSVFVQRVKRAYRA